MNLSLGRVNWFKEYCKAMMKELKGDGLPIVICGNEAEERFFPFFDENNLSIDNIYDREANRGKIKVFGGG